MSNQVLPRSKKLNDGSVQRIRHDGCELITRPLIEPRPGPHEIPKYRWNEKIIIKEEPSASVNSPLKGSLVVSKGTKTEDKRTAFSSSLIENPASSERCTYEEHDDGHGLAVLLRACELLDSGQQKEAKSPRKHVADRSVRSPNKTPRSSRSCSPSKSRQEKPHGPCMNPNCSNPQESPQWRKGPPECPVLCNACGTRWIRNRSLVPLVPKRGIRYNKGKTRSPMKSDVKDEDQAILNNVTMAKSEKIEITANY